MAVFTGTATSHTDLLNKIVTHLTNPAVGAMGTQAWALLLSRTVSGEEERYLKAPGLSGTEEIYINITTTVNVGTDIYNWQIRGATGHNPAFTFVNQPGSSPSAFALLWQNSIPYTLVANGRRFILVAKISTSFCNAYAGHIIPYATSAEMPYPLFVGAVCDRGYRWSQTGYWVGSFFDPAGWTSAAPTQTSGAFLRHFDGTWVSVQNYYDSSGNPVRSSTGCNVWPWFNDDVRMAPNYDGGYTLLQSMINTSYFGGNVYGELQGTFFISGFANAAENTITVAGKTYLVTQNMWRTGRNDYAAILLE